MQKWSHDCLPSTLLFLKQENDRLLCLQVYDGTAFLQDHPGGAESILLASGMDSTEDFNAIHSAKAKKMLDDYYIGDLDDSAPCEFLSHIIVHSMTFIDRLSARLKRQMTAQSN